MIRNIILFIILYWGVSMNANAFTVEGLLGFIFEEVTKDAPEKWEKVTTRFEMKTIDGTFNSSSEYKAKIIGKSELVSFETTNLWGPHNAARKIQELKASEGEHFTVIKIYMSPDGKVSYETK